MNALWRQKPDDIPQHVRQIWAGSSYRGVAAPRPGRSVNRIITGNGQFQAEVPLTVRARLQQFTAILGWLPFKTCEIYISPISTTEAHGLERQLVAQSYRREDRDYGWKQANKYSRQPAGTYSLSEVEDSFRTFISHGEPSENVLARREQYVARANDRPTPNYAITNNYIDYKVVAALVAFLAKRGPSDRDAIARPLWDSVIPCIQSLYDGGLWLNDHDGMVLAPVRDALRYIIEIYDGRLILEESDAKSTETLEKLKSDSCERIQGLKASDLAKQNREAAVNAIPVAIELWKIISDHSHAICATVANSLGKLPLEITSFLFEARTRAYVPYLQSATLAVEKVHKVKLHSDLNEKIKVEGNLRNKSVDVVTKDAYQSAAVSLLRAGDCEKELRSMLLLPFSAKPGEWSVHGFVRLMNRIAPGGGNYAYPNRDVPDQEEEELGRTVAAVLYEGLSERSLWGLPEEKKTANDMQKTVNQRSTKPISSTEKMV